MADNINITPGAGAAVATDEAGARHYQRVKLTDGAEGSEQHASVRADGTQEVSLTDLAAALWAILEALTRPIQVEPGTGRMRVALEAAAVTMTGVTTVAAVTSLNQLNTWPINDVLLKGLDRNLWNNSVRQRIS